ncbi:hypothetical protein [Butyrivibrio sp. JL13D10]|uniref:hypothetical protein n=1 Tax=Butyrivibrio sp. JL13D10 TaxID=3236815 RepID=UPI0038B56801
MDIFEVLEDYNCYRQDIKVITEKCTSEEYEAIPDQWKDLLKASPAKKIDIVIDLWQAAVKEEMSLTIAYLKEHIEDILIVKFDEKYSLIYLIKRDDGEILHYIGGSPVESFTIQDDISASIRNFYTKLHDGFYDYCFKALGLPDLKHVTPLSENTGDRVFKDFDKAYVFFENGMGDYVAYDTLSKKGILWLKGEEPEFGNEFWDLVDEWTIIGLGE